MIEVECNEYENNEGQQASAYQIDSEPKLGSCPVDQRGTQNQSRDRNNTKCDVQRLAKS